MNLSSCLIFWNWVHNCFTSFICLCFPESNSTSPIRFWWKIRALWSFLVLVSRVLAGEDHRVLMVNEHKITSFWLLTAQKWNPVSTISGLWTMILYEPYPVTGESCVYVRSKGSIIWVKRLSGTEKRWQWNWPIICLLFSGAMPCPYGLQSLLDFLSSSRSLCPCICCLIICQPTRTQR